MAIQFQPSPHSPLMQEADVELPNGQCLRIEMGGQPDRPVILLIMGLGAQLIFWPEPFCHTLIEAGYRVIRYDHRDAGLSSKTDKPLPKFNLVKLLTRHGMGLPSTIDSYNLYDLAEDASLLIEALDLKAVHVIGGSMGGMIAQILAAKHPEQVLSLGLLFTSNNQAMLVPPHPKQLKALMTKPPSDDPEVIIQHIIKTSKIIGSPQYVDENDLQQFAYDVYHRSFYPQGFLLHFLAILCTGSLRHLDKQIQQHTIVVHGSEDRLLPPAHGKAVAKAIKNAKFELIEGMGHDLPRHFLPQLAQLFLQHIESLNV